MHYLTWVILDKDPGHDNLDEALGSVLEPYSEHSLGTPETSTWPGFTWDWYQVGGRWSGSLTGNEYGNGYQSHPDDVQPVKGFGCESLPYHVVTADGFSTKKLRNPNFATDWSTLDTIPYEIENPDFGAAVVTALRTNPDGVVVVVDVHR